MLIGEALKGYNRDKYFISLKFLSRKKLFWTIQKGRLRDILITIHFGMK